MNFNVIPTLDALKPYVECIRTTEYDGEKCLTINVCLNGLPGIVFQHHNGRSPIEAWTTASLSLPSFPPLVIVPVY